MRILLALKVTELVLGLPSVTKRPREPFLNSLQAGRTNIGWAKRSTCLSLVLKLGNRRRHMRSQPRWPAHRNQICAVPLGVEKSPTIVIPTPLPRSAPIWCLHWNLRAWCRDPGTTVWESEAQAVSAEWVTRCLKA